jgi:hypothetical protein
VIFYIKGEDSEEHTDQKAASEAAASLHCSARFRQALMRSPSCWSIAGPDLVTLLRGGFLGISATACHGDLRPPGSDMTPRTPHAPSFTKETSEKTGKSRRTDGDSGRTGFAGQQCKQDLAMFSIGQAM